MKTLLNITYTESERKLLYSSLAPVTQPWHLATLKEACEQLTTGDNCPERILIFRSLPDSVEKDLFSYEPYGEAKTFVIFLNKQYLEFNFWTRHLKNFLFQSKLSEMPLYLNMYFMNYLAAWRLRIAK
jgi:hypothetical protein